MFNIRVKRALLPLFILFISTRILTGAPEAQVNFTSLLFDHYPKSSLDNSHHTSGTPQAVKIPSHAGTIPEEFKKFSLYKKYISPKSLDFDTPHLITFAAFEEKTIFAEQQNLFTLREVNAVSHSPPLNPNSFTYSRSHKNDLEFGIHGITKNSSGWKLSGL